jgi:anti-anti-sigma factor
MRAPAFSVRTERVGPATSIVVVTGDVDLATAPEFEDELAHAVQGSLETPALVVDLSAVTFIGTAGLNALVRAFERQRMAGRPLALVSDDSRVAMILEVTRLEKVLKRYRTRDDAVLAVNKF